MPIGRPLSPVTVSTEQREQLQSWSRRRKTAQALAPSLADRAACLDRNDGHSDRVGAGYLHPDGEQVVASLCGLRARRASR